MLPWRWIRNQATTQAQKTSIHCHQRRSSSESRRKPPEPVNFKIASLTPLRALGRVAAQGQGIVAALLHRVDSLRESGVLGQLIRFGIVGGLNTLVYAAVYW